jgi:hypothetical protein
VIVNAPPSKRSSERPAESPAERAAPAARRRVSIRTAIIAAGALAGAIASIIGVGSTVAGWLKDGPEGTVETLHIQSIRPLSYGEWREHESVPTAGVPASQLRAPGKLITFNVVTNGYSENDLLPVRIIVHDTTHERSQTIVADPVRVRHGKDCGCVDWVPVPRGNTSYFLEVSIFPPGPIKGDALQSEAEDFPASRAASGSSAPS